jgi:hypothetical protein
MSNRWFATAKRAALLMGLLLAAWSAEVAVVTAAVPPCDDGTTPTTLNDLRVVKECTATVPGAGKPTTTTYTTTRRAELGDHLVVMVSGLSRFRAAANAPVDWSRIVLVIDGQPLKGVTPLFSDISHSHLEFVLTQDAANRAAWIPVLSGAIRDRAVTLTVGLDGQPPLPSDVDDFRLIAIPTVWAWVWFAITACTAVLLVWTARCSNVLRDVGPNPIGENGVARFKPYSLARTQMAVWFFVVLASYLFIWLVTGTLDSLTASVLALTGISAATAVAGTTIDTRNQAIATSSAAAPALLGAAPLALAAAPAVLEPPPAANEAAQHSEGFFTDILSDQQGFSLARVQIAVWTMVLVIVFIRSVWKQLAMPEFDATLLGLMGISNGTYVGFKGLEAASSPTN